jgi:indole-3-glycerol phosphate synthase
MTNILNTIIEHKRKEVSERQALYPTKLLEKSPYFTTPTVSLRRYLAREDKVGIIAEIKRRSPSKGIINNHISVAHLSVGYMQAGASALSVLTDTNFFGGSSEDLKVARKFNLCPILRKEFIIDPYQVIEARSIGADAILLIAAALTPSEVAELSQLAQSLGLEVLLETHSEEEISSHLCDSVDLVGVNNRDLTTFTVSLETSERLAGAIPASFMKVTESGIDNAEAILRLKKAGYTGFLIGEAFMRTSDPARACHRLIEQVRASEA